MRRLAPHTTAVVVAALAVAGCGGSTTHTTAASTQPTTTASQQATPTVLEQAVRRAVSENHALLTEALLTNHVPASPNGTAGPALADVRRSAAQRRAQGVRVRILSERLRVLSVQLDPSYATATATIINTQRVRPIYRGHAGRPSASSEHVQLELHRVGGSERFVVWNVTPV
jgi:hypothetical protein